MNDLKCDFCDREGFKNQIVFEDESSIVIYPKKPIIFHHLIIFPKNHQKTIDETSAKEIESMKNIIHRIFKNFESMQNCIGYNLNSNNGNPQIGQTVPHSHVHMYLRFEDEKISPFKVMADLDLKEELTSEEWNVRKIQIENVISRAEN